MCIEFHSDLIYFCFVLINSVAKTHIYNIDK